VLQTVTSTIGVGIFYSTGFPVTIVSLLEFDPKAKYRASNAVFHVRNYLKQEFSKPSDSPITFHSQGPTPFHAEFFFSENAAQVHEGSTIAFHLTKKAGYAHVDLFHDSGRTLEAWNALMADVTRAAGVFYRMVATQQTQSRRWEKINEGLPKH
jgi:hypothetical protein